MSKRIHTHATDGQKLYKVTGPNGEANNGGNFTYDLPDGDTPGAWTPEIEPVWICNRGYHVTTDPKRWLQTRSRVFEVEIDATLSEADRDKVVARSIRLTREVDPGEVIPDYRIIRRATETLDSIIPNLGQANTLPDFLISTVGYVDPVREETFFAATRRMRDMMPRKTLPPRTSDLQTNRGSVRAIYEYLDLLWAYDAINAEVSDLVHGLSDRIDHDDEMGYEYLITSDVIMAMVAILALDKQVNSHGEWARGVARVVRTGGLFTWLPTTTRSIIPIYSRSGK